MRLLLEPLNQTTENDEVRSGGQQTVDAQLLGAEQLFDKGERNTFAEEKWEIQSIGAAIRSLWSKMVVDDAVADEIGRDLGRNIPVGFFASRQSSMRLKLDSIRCGSPADLATLATELRDYVVASQPNESSAYLLDFLRNPLTCARFELDFLRVSECVEALCLR